MPAVCRAQDAPAKPIDAPERLEWVTASIVGPKSLAAGVFVAGFDTAIEAASPQNMKRRLICMRRASVPSGGIASPPGT